MFIYIHICLLIHVYICIHMYIHMCIFIYVYIHTLQGVYIGGVVVACREGPLRDVRITHILNVTPNEKDFFPNRCDLHVCAYVFANEYIYYLYIHT